MHQWAAQQISFILTDMVLCCLHGVDSFPLLQWANYKVNLSRFCDLSVLSSTFEAVILVLLIELLVLVVWWHDGDMLSPSWGILHCECNNGQCLQSGPLVVILSDYHLQKGSRVPSLLGTQTATTMRLLTDTRG